MSAPEPWWPSRYGAGDQLGALNEITAAKVVAAARLVRSGRVYDVGRTLHADIPRFEGRFWHQTLVTSAHMINRRRAGSPDGGLGANRLNWIAELVSGTFQMGRNSTASATCRSATDSTTAGGPPRSSKSGGRTSLASRRSRPS